MRRLSLALLMAAPLWLAGCDMLGMESATQVAAKRDAEGRAVGGACRHAARSIEECYAHNKRSDKAAIFAGWREMNDYMRENKIESATASGEAEVGAAAQGDAKLASSKGAKPEPEEPVAKKAAKKGG